ncbi:hypothetical protein FSP39_023358 [Pinctada imbricata]|uniref:G-protein coupled receptors family 1 profile domain-containing protein n=1 Tax=Pinctada imbricata TaxID=66713 RepID=A0AA88YFH8_PINIB|nr:hypothetical protein FSP39_023358 [Pinctada imbricata]
MNSNVTTESTLTNELILLSIGLPIFIENSLAIFILSRCDKLIFHVKSLSLNLCLADCLTGLMLMTPKSVFEYLFSCKMKKYFNFAAVVCSLLTATAINLDRVLSLYLNFRYTKKVTKCRLVFTCLLSWIISIPLSYAYFFAPNEPLGVDCSLRSTTSSHPLSLITRFGMHLTIVLNVGLFVYMIRYIRTERRPAQNTDCVQGSTSTTIEMLKKIILISGFLFVSVTPAIIVMEIQEIFPSSLLLQKIKYTTEILLLSNSFINPLLYVWRYYEVKYQVKRLLCFWNPKRLETLDRDRKQYFAPYNISIF